jgi:hypothetical protein
LFKGRGMGERVKNRKKDEVTFPVSQP